MPEFLNPYAAIDRKTHWLPHWQQGEVVQFITWRLADALPAGLLGDWREERLRWIAFHPKPWDERTQEDYAQRFGRQFEQWLDAGHGECLLQSPECAGIIATALEYFDRDRYVIMAYVVMPNHVHVLFAPDQRWRVDRLVHSWKSYTAKQINRLLGRQGVVWQAEYFDRLMRSELQFRATARYIRENPIKAQLRPGQYRLEVRVDLEG